MASDLAPKDLPWPDLAVPDLPKPDASPSCLSGFLSLSGPNYEQGRAVDADGACNACVIGIFSKSITIGTVTLTAPSEALYVARIAPSGTVAWAKAFPGATSSMGGGVALDSKGGCAVTGSYASTITIGTTTLVSNGSDDMLVFRLDSAGNPIWAVGGGSASPDDSGTAIVVDASDNVHAIGTTWGGGSIGTTVFASKGSADAVVVTVTPAGQVAWVGVFGGTSSDTGAGIGIDAQGNRYIEGTFFGSVVFGSTTLTNASTTVYVAKLDSSGTPVWAYAPTTTQGNYLYGPAFHVAPSGDSFIGGSLKGTASFGSTTLTAQGTNTDAIMAKVSASGNPVWASIGGGNGSEYGYAIDVDASGRAFLAGYFNGTATFGTITLTSQGSSDIYVVRLSPAGVFEWAVSAGGASFDEARGLAVAGNTLLVSGYYSGSAIFGTQTLTGTGTMDAYLWALTPP